MANPTTNYGWPMPTSTDLVTDLPADFAAFGQPVDTSLKALNPETTLGDISYRSATANTNTRLAIGSTGNVLTVSGGVPAWVAPAGGGKVLQVVQGTLTTSASSSSTTFVDTGLSVSITPSSASSKVLIMVTHNGSISTNPALDAGMYFNTYRGATSLVIPGTGLHNYIYVGPNSGARDYYTVSSWQYLDSPATTSATTYKTQYKTAGAGTAEANHTNCTSVIIAMEIGA
jgi:hypothetical protein